MVAVDEIFSLVLTMSTSRRRRCSSHLFILTLLVFLYSIVQCDTSNIFDFFKRTSSSSSSPSHSHYHVSSSSSPSGPSTGAGRSEEGGARDHHDDDGLSVTIHDATPKHHSSSSYDGGYSSVARGHHSHGGWGYGGGHGGDSNLDLYSLLGGLSFASLLGATIVFLARRNQNTMMVVNATGRRRRRDLDDDDDMMDEDGGETLPEFMDKLLGHLDYPWWQKENAVDKKNVVPFKLK